MIILHVIPSDHSLSRLSSLARRTLHTRSSTLLSSSRSLHGHLISLNALHALGGTTLRRDVNMVATIIADEVRQILNSAGARVVDGLVLGAGAEEFDGRETLDFVRDVVEGGVDLGDDDLVGVRLIEAG